MKITYQPIGMIHTPFKDFHGMPIQPGGGCGIRGQIEIYPAFAAGLQDLDGFSHLLLVYHFHQTSGYQLKVVPFLDEVERGLFATRAQRRPNPIGISVVRLVRVQGNILEIEDLDILDGTPLLDIKPYVPEFNPLQVDRVGWLHGKGQAAHKGKSDDRFR